jgi:hypothetical protein
MCRGGIFSNAGQAGFVPEKDLLAAIGLLSSSVCGFLVSLSQGRTGDAAQFEVGLIKRLPWPDLSSEWLNSGCSTPALRICDARRDWFRGNELSAEFVAPHLLACRYAGLARGVAEVARHKKESDERIREALAEINQQALRGYRLEPADEQAFAAVASDGSGNGDGVDGETTEQVDQSDEIGEPRALVSDLISYTIGACLGRWDFRFATGQKQPPALTDPFAPVPPSSPGMLQGPDGLPLAASPAGYPLPVAWDGFLVDDPDHERDVVRQVRAVLELVWKDRAESFEQEACQMLGVEELRDYFRKPGPGGFWSDHIARYSKSRRKAPIYWLLQSSKKNYALWLYYHRLDKDILFKALIAYVEPKLRLENGRLAELRGKRTGATGKAARQIEREMERQEAFISELADFRDKLERAAKRHLEPDLNDGVVLNIAPLWELVPWKEAKAYWDELLAGKYEWSSIGKQLRQKGLVR